MTTFHQRDVTRLKSWVIVAKLYVGMSRCIKVNRELVCAASLHDLMDCETPSPRLDVPRLNDLAYRRLQLTEAATMSSLKLGPISKRLFCGVHVRNVQHLL